MKKLLITIIIALASLGANASEEPRGFWFNAEGFTDPNGNVKPPVSIYVSGTYDHCERIAELLSANLYTCTSCTQDPLYAPWGR